MRFRTVKMNVKRDFNRLIWPTVIAIILIVGGAPLAEVVGLPQIAPWGTFTGATFLTAVVAHLIRRMFFPRLDLQSIAIEAAKNGGTGAGLVALALCLVISAITLTAGAMFRV